MKRTASIATDALRCAQHIYDDILAAEPDWAEALHAAFGFLADQGDLARVRTTLADARRDYEQAHRLAQPLTAGDPSNTQWQHDLGASYIKLGAVAVAQGQLAEAAWAYGKGLAIRKRLAVGDPSNTQGQPDLWVSYWKLAELAERQDKAEEARGYWKRAFDVLSDTKNRRLHLSPEDRPWLETLRQRAGAAGP